MSLATKLAQIPQITTNYIPRATAAGFVNGVIYDNGASIGIGTTAPVSLLHILKGSGNGAEIYASYGSTSVYSEFVHNNNGGALNLRRESDGQTNTILRAYGNTALNVLTGNVGIGTSSITSYYGFAKTLSVEDTSSAEIQLKATGGTNTLASFGAATNGTYFQSATQPIITVVNGAERMRITSSGNVGIGTSSPVTYLDVIGSTTNSSIKAGTIEFQSYALNNGWLAENVYYNGSAHVYRQTGTAGLIYFASQGLRFNAIPSGTVGSTINLPNQMTLTNGGNVLIGTTTDLGSNYKLVVSNPSGDTFVRIASGAGAYSTTFTMGSSSGGSSRILADYFLLVSSGGSGGVYLSSGSTSWAGNSDLRLKDIIKPIDSAVEKLESLNPVVFSWKSDKSKKEVLGLIAQDVEKVFPEVIDIQNDEMKTMGVRYTELIPVLIKAIQEQQEQINSLKAQLGGN